MFNWFKKSKPGPQLPTPKDKYDRAVLGDIERVGWSVICINDGSTPYQFSVGMFHTLKHPEIIILGLKQEVGGYIINQIGGTIALGKTIKPDVLNEDYTNTGNYFKTVDPVHYTEYCGYAKWLYRGSGFPMYQCVWPLKSGLYPWDAGYPPEGAEIQPLLT
ncbi:MAG: DUF4262 domain-containing protein [Planctomycetaceae bacterium]|nr:DUF4262 domain-containing protein [Planctomycetaceae bacterium]